MFGGGGARIKEPLGARRSSVMAADRESDDLLGAKHNQNLIVASCDRCVC